MGRVVQCWSGTWLMGRLVFGTRRMSTIDCWIRRSVDSYALVDWLIDGLVDCCMGGLVVGWVGSS